MKNAFTKHAYLKAGLLLALAANVSWNHASTVVSSMDLAQVAAEGSDVAGSARTRETTPAPANPGAPSTNPNAAVAGAGGVRPDAPSTAQPVPGPRAPIDVHVESATVRSSNITVCNKPLRITYTEVAREGQTFTDILVVSRFPDAQEFLLQSTGSLAFNIDDASNYNQMRHHIMTRLQESDRYKCDVAPTAAAAAAAAPAAPVAGSPAAPVQPVADAEERTPEQERERIARGLRNCTLDARGEAVRNSAKLQCHLDAIDAIANSADEDSDEEDDRRGKSRAERDVQAHVRAIQNKIRELVTSSREEKNDEGEDLIDDLTGRLESLSDSDVLPESTVKRFVQSTEAMRTGGEVFRFARESEDEVDDLSAAMRENADVIRTSQNPYEIQQAAMNLQNLSNQRQLMQNQLMTNSSYVQLTQLARRNVISSSDLRKFTTGYDPLMAQLRSLSDLRSLVNGGTVASGQPASSDILAGRQTAFSGENRSYGITIPNTAPTLDFLNNSGTAAAAALSAPSALFTGLNSSNPRVGGLN